MADFTNAKLNHAKFQYSDLEYIDFRNAEINKADFAYADLQNAKLPQDFFDENIANNWAYALYTDEYRKTQLCPMNKRLVKFEVIIRRIIFYTKSQEKWKDKINNEIEKYIKSKDMSCFDFYLPKKFDLDSSYHILEKQTVSKEDIFKEEDIFRNRELSGVDFSKSSFPRTDFTNSTLIGAKFQNANLIKVKWNNANVKCADFRNAKNLDLEELKNAKNWENIITENNIPPECGVDRELSN